MSTVTLKAKSVNLDLASRLDEAGRLLLEQGANPYRVRAYQRAAETLRALDRPVTEILETEGLEGLDRLPGIGMTLARAIRDTVRLGRMPMLERLRGEMDPVSLLSSVPGIGERLAHKIHEDLGIDSLEDLEAAAHDGRLASIAGLGRKRVAGVIDTLESRLRRVRMNPTPTEEAPVEEILDVDREYREEAAAGTLHRIAPRRFNPEGKAWLPILHTQRGPRHYTALFSNTARAHEQGKTDDWVVLYYDGGGGERQNTVITSERAPLRGRRIVRGREDECARYYAAESPSPRRRTEMKDPWRKLLVFVAGFALAAGVAAGSGIDEIDRYHRVNDRVAVAGQPTPAQVGAIAQAGFRTIINLRQESELDAQPEIEAAKDAGLRYISIPILSASPSEERVGEFLRVTDDPDIYPVFIHCATANRASALWMVRRVLRDGWTLEEAEREAGQNGLTSESLRKFAREYIETHVPRPAN